jgi:CheY-like chemotaxis protein
MLLQRSKVLVIDDDADLLRLVTLYLRHSCLVITATDGPSGLEKARKTQPDLILCDVHMPGWDGLTTVKKLRQVRSLKGIPILMLTADARPHVVKAALEVGASGYILKDGLDCEGLNGRIAEAIYCVSD